MKTEIEKYGPCSGAVEFRKQFNTFQEAWEACPRGDWMLWIAKKVGVDKRTLTLAKGLCADTVVHLMKDQRSRNAVTVAIAYGNGNASEEELADAAYAAYDAAADAAASAAYAAANAAYATAAAAYATYSAAEAAAEADYSAYDAAAYAAAKKQNQNQTADICREVLTENVMQLI